MSSSSSPQISVPAFPGRRTFHLWRREVEDISSRLGPGAYGLLGFILAPADWLLLANIGQAAGPFAPVPNPGLQPPPVPANVHALWVADLDRFERQVSVVNAFTLALIASLDAPTKQVIAPNGFRGLGLAQILAALVVEYGVATPADITDIRSALQIPFIAGTSFADHVSAWDGSERGRPSTRSAALHRPHLSISCGSGVVRRHLSHSCPPDVPTVGPDPTDRG